jgi:hypothetical protein
MIAVAMRLSEAGVKDYWDDADRWIRNQFAENQLLETEWIYDLAKKYDRRPNTGPDALLGLGAHSYLRRRKATSEFAPKPGVALGRRG